MHGSNELITRVGMVIVRCRRQRLGQGAAAAQTLPAAEKPHGTAVATQTHEHTESTRCPPSLSLSLCVRAQLVSDGEDVGYSQSISVKMYQMISCTMRAQSVYGMPGGYAPRPAESSYKTTRLLSISEAFTGDQVSSLWLPVWFVGVSAVVFPRFIARNRRNTHAQHARLRLCLRFRLLLVRGSFWRQSRTSSASARITSGRSSAPSTRISPARSRTPSSATG